MLPIGAAFDHFVVEAEIGRGAMGSVYRAMDTRLKRRVALKVMLVDPSFTPEQSAVAKARLLREARAAATLHHPNAVAIYELGEVDDSLFIAMELITGRTLRSFVGDPTVSWSRKLAWMLDVARALGAAHATGLVHRDIKPANIMVHDDGSVRVLDFGIARRASPDPESGPETLETDGLETLTQRGQIVGTPLYMAPEQLRGEAVDGRADQFAWAVVTYELLAGRVPWRVPNDVLASMACIMVQPPPPLREAAPELPQGLVSAIERALAKKPEERFTSMGDLVAAIEPYVTGTALPRVTVRAPTPEGGSPGEPTEKLESQTTLDLSNPGTARTSIGPVRRPRRWGIAATAVLSIAALAAATMLVVHAKRAPHPSEPLVVTMLDLPKPSSSSPGALADYTAAMQALHDGNWENADRLFKEACRLDPALAQAHLHLAFMDVKQLPGDARDNYSSALQLRSTLTPREGLVLDALEPLVTRDPEDMEATSQRLDALATRFPRDAEIAFFEATIDFWRGHAEEAGRALDRALALDAKFGAALSLKGQLAFDRAGANGVRENASRCLSLVPNDTQCLAQRLFADSYEGRCEDVERDTKRWAAIDPDSSAARDFLGKTAYALGRPQAAVDELLRQATLRCPESVRPWCDSDRVSNLALLSGDFAEAERAARALATELRDSPQRDVHGSSATTIARLRLELGDDAGAAAAARDYLAREESWLLSPYPSRYSIRGDPTPWLLDVLRRSGGMQPSEFERQRQAWLDEWRHRMAPADLPFVWLYGYGPTTRTPEEAARALEQQSAFGTMPWYRTSLGDELVGQIDLLAGRIDEAVELLTRGTRGCTAAFDDVLTWVASEDSLGRALETKGAAGPACDAYRVVVEHWGGVKGSTTAGHAKARMAALHCAR